MIRAVSYASLTLAMVLSALANAAETGLPQVRYQLHQAPDTEVIEPLRRFAERGDRPSMRLLASRLVSLEQLDTTHEAIGWYWRAFDRGYGKPLALAGMSEIADRMPLFREQIRSLLQQGLNQLDPLANDETLNSVLDLFLVYPELLPSDQVEHLIGQYQRACVLDCRALTYQARLLEARGQLEQAERRYRQAMLLDARAVGLYSRMLGDNAFDGLLSVAQAHQSRLPELPAEVVEMLAVTLTRTPRQHDNAILLWLDQAIAWGSFQALLAKAGYLLDHPDVFDHQAAFRLIEQISLRDPDEAGFLRAQALQVYDWPSLDPEAAQRQLQTLAPRHPDRVQLAMAQLYSSGGLDEPDHRAALALYQPLLTRPNAAAHYRVATLYAGTRAMCPDPVKGYGYARIAELLGSARARLLRQQLETRLSPEQHSRGQALVHVLRQRLEQSI
ncbi:hypothetical protein [Marinobacter sp. CA1]|uniref:hypothetical protein n=1 Tax=Marinobacter sp. CA1 TaxID=2817656 RepID=UPI001D08A4E2|nr:hypothetical protein [Marinobacter sp. CA1]UDL04661.1 hypothetical protein J2887_18625 [Marinobacter sp. CA1]